MNTTLNILALSLLFTSPCALAGAALKAADIEGTSGLAANLVVIAHYAAHSQEFVCQEHPLFEPAKAKIYYDERSVSLGVGQKFEVHLEAKADSCDFRISTIAISIEDPRCASAKPGAARCADGVQFTEGTWGNRPFANSEVATCGYQKLGNAPYFTCATKAFPVPEIIHDGSNNGLLQYRLPTDASTFDLHLDIQPANLPGH